MKSASVVRCFPPTMKSATVCRILAVDKGLHRKSRGIMDGHKNRKSGAKRHSSGQFRIPTKDEKRMAYAFGNSRSLDRFL